MHIYRICQKGAKTYPPVPVVLDGELLAVRLVAEHELLLLGVLEEPLEPADAVPGVLAQHAGHPLFAVDDHQVGQKELGVDTHKPALLAEQAAAELKTNSRINSWISSQ